VKRERLPYRPGIDSIVEKDNERSAPEATNRKRMIPPSGTPHLMRPEVEGVDLGLGQIVPSGNIALRLHFWKSWKIIDEVLLPSPRHHRPQM
jgi:hypothetical protein